MNEKEYKKTLAGMGCIVCRLLFNIKDSEVQLHHYRSGGWGKGDYTTLIPLCPEHHVGKTGIHGMGTKAFDKHYSQKGFTQEKLLILTREMMSNSLEIPAEKNIPPSDF